jgi:FMN-dependent oxidoreductase (nitrilotriacetate monooxygenase family)
MAKEIRLNAFDMNCVGHIQHGMWTHPRDRSTEYNTIKYWQDLARLAERGKFDGIFLADIVGVYDVYRGGPAPSIVDAVQIPVNDPMMVVPVMAAVTEHIGFGVTANLTYEPPYLFARRMSTLDHLTGGRVGWNIVTGYLDSAARGMGLAAQPDHDGRYDAADEYMSVVYQLWEASWEDGAVLRDKSNRIFADPAKIHRVRHHGRHYQIDAIHLAEPSPQRTPVLYQAGSSTRGRDFAATHAECVFVFGADKRITRDLVADIRSRAAAHGRDPRDILIFYNRAAVVGRTRREAEDKYRDYHEHASIEGALAHFSSSTGLDFSRYEPDEPIRYVKNDAINSAVEAFTLADPNRTWTVREIAEFVGIGGMGPILVGSPEQIADELESWIETTDIDGFNLYFGARGLMGGPGRSGWRWLDLRRLSANIVAGQSRWPGAQVTRVAYCTAQIDGASNPSGARDQAVYLRALRAANAVDVIEMGYYVNRVARAPLAVEGPRGQPVLTVAD